MRNALHVAPERKEMRSVFPAGPALSKLILPGGIGSPNSGSSIDISGDEDDDDRQVGHAVKLVPAPRYTVRDNIKSIAVYSCGWDALGVKYQPTLPEIVDSLNAVLQRKFKAMPAIDGYVETKMFTDWFDGPRHCGENILALSKVVDHGAFPAFLSDVKNILHEISDLECSPSGHVALMAVCKGGSCRGVSVARILSHIFDRAGYLCGSPNHLHKLAWQRKKVCYRCCDCDVENPDRLAILEKAFKTWNRT